MTYDIDDILFFQARARRLKLSRPPEFRGPYFYGDATAFKNKCSANVTYTNAFTGSRCTNIPT